MKKDTKIGFIITYFHTSEESLNLLKKNIETLSKEDYYLVISSHSPISSDLQELCDFYIYQSKNVVDNRKYSHGVAESNLIELSIKHLKDQNIEWTYKVTYDVEINDVNRFLDWRVDGYQFVSCNWGDNIICTNSFYSKIDFLLENINFYRTIDEMFALNTVLENCWEYSFRHIKLFYVISKTAQFLHADISLDLAILRSLFLLNKRGSFLLEGYFAQNFSFFIFFRFR